MFPEADRNARLDQVSAPFQRAADEAEKQVASAIEARKPSSEILILLTKFEEAYQQLRTVRFFDQRTSSDPVQGYRALAGVLKAAESGNSDAAMQALSGVRGEFRGADKTRREQFEQLVTQWERRFREESVERAQSSAKKLRERLPAVKNPKDLDTIVDELRSERMSNPIRANPDPLAQLISALSTLCLLYTSDAADE